MSHGLQRCADRAVALRARRPQHSPRSRQSPSHQTSASSRKSRSHRHGTRALETRRRHRHHSASHRRHSHHTGHPDPSHRHPAEVKSAGANTSPTQGGARGPRAPEETRPRRPQGPARRRIPTTFPSHLQARQHPMEQILHRPPPQSLEHGLATVLRRP